MLSIPPPPVPSLEVGVAYLAGGIALGCGLVLLLAGRLVDRVLLALVGAAIGAAIAGPLAASWGVNWMVVAVTAAVVLAVVFVLSSRVLWALAAGAMFACLGTLVAAVAYWPGLELAAASQPAASQAAAASQPADALAAWAQSCADLSHRTVLALWDQRFLAMIWTLVLAGGMPLVTAIMLPRLARIVMTALLGALALVGGAVLVLTPSHIILWPDRWALVALWGLLAVVLMIAGTIHQYYRALSKPVEAKPAGPPKAPPKPTPK